MYRKLEKYKKKLTFAFKLQRNEKFAAVGAKVAGHRNGFYPVDLWPQEKTVYKNDLNIEGGPSPPGRSPDFE